MALTFCSSVEQERVSCWAKNAGVIVSLNRSLWLILFIADLSCCEETEVVAKRNHIKKRHFILGKAEFYKVTAILN